ncbi:MAG: hypothetical protein SV186_03055 [Candidatus Nanohaloarchaea archaeon]|nr:hypothetical protein [Candidatus Nanohaloarchaea archaeon]
MMRKGYMHAIEGVIASMLVLLYLSTIISAPQPTDWRETSLTKRAGDVLRTLTESGIMQRALLDNDPGVISAVTDALGTGMEYTMYISGLPRQQLDIGILMNASEIVRVGSQPGGGGSGLPGTEGDYRSGTVLGVEFILSDNASNDITRYTSVNFDFNDNGRYNETIGSMDEGPHNFGDLIAWCPGGTCSGQQYQVGYINETLTLYNLSSYRWFNQTVNDIRVSRFDITSTLTATEVFTAIHRPFSSFSRSGGFYETTAQVKDFQVGIRVGTDNETLYINESGGFEGPYSQGDEIEMLGQFFELTSVMPVNATPTGRIDPGILFTTNAPSLLDTYRDALEDYLTNGNTLLEMADFTGYDTAQFDGSFHDRVGFDWISYPLIRTGPSYNTFFDGQAGTASSIAKSYFRAATIDVPQERYVVQTGTGPDYAVTNASIRGTEYIVNASLDADTVTFKRGGFSATYTAGQRVELEGNLFQVMDTYPLRMRTSDAYQFASMHPGRIVGGQPVLHAPDWSWNVSAASTNVTGLSTNVDFEGWPQTDCSPAHRGRFFTLEGTTYAVTTTNFQPCERQFEYVNFDFNQNGQVDDNSTVTGEGYSAEGIFQEGEIVQIDDRQYRISIGRDGTWVYLKRVAPPTVPTAMWIEDAYNGNGDVFLTGRTDLGIDGEAFIKAVMARAAMKRYRFSKPKVIGSPSKGVSYTSDIEGAVYTPFQVESLWWFQ